MGDDTALAVLSLQPRLLYTYFCQLFAQVTNPPIDPLREKLVMSLNTIMGWRRNLFGETPEHARLISAESPILFEHELEALRAHDTPETKLATVNALWPAHDGADGLERRRRTHLRGGRGGRGRRLPARRAERPRRGPRERARADAAGDGRGASPPHPRRQADAREHHLRDGRGARRAPHGVPHRLRREQRRAVPRLRDVPRDHRKDARRGPARRTRRRSRRTVRRWRAALLKIMSKMGISVLASYRGAQIFEAVGLASKLVENCFTGTSTQIEGVGFARDRRGKPAAARAGLRRARRRHGKRKPRRAAKPGLLPVPPAGRGARGDAADDQEFPHLRADQQAGGLQEIRRQRRSTRSPSRCATCWNSSRPRAGRCRWRKSSPSRTSAAGSRRRACRWARSARRRTNASPSP